MPPDEAQDPSELALVLLELNRFVIDKQALAELLQQLTLAARSTVAGADRASVSLQHDGSVFTSNASDDVARELDDVQYASDEGPCLDALRHGRQVSLSLAEDPDRYARFSSTARERFVNAVLSTPVRVESRPIGALNLYSETVAEFGEAQADVASMFATQAAALLANAATTYKWSRQDREHLERALQSRDLIGLAKGMLMERTGCSADEAFAMLRRESQATDLEVIVLARTIVMEGRRFSTEDRRQSDPDG